MTQEEKAKAYDKALSVAMETYKTQPMYRDWLEKMFPELKESEDEKIRKAIRYAIGQSTHSDGTLINGVSSEEALAWLEKQGEQKPSIIIPKFRVGDTIRIKNSNAEYTITKISDGYYLGKGWCLDIVAGDECGDYELVEQKQWKPSEEQMAVLNEVINYAANSELQHWSSFIYTLLKSLREELKKLREG